jgi:uncharacterized protein YggE
MKSTVLFSVFFFLTTITFAQEGFKGEHFIEVSGTARQEVEPNEIYVNVQLREFEENREKVSLEKLDKEFWDAIKNAGIDRKKVTIANVGSQFGKLGRKDKDAFREKTYQLILSSGAELEKLLEKVEPVKVNQITLTKITHTELEKYRLELKVKALQAAKAKADALLKSIGSEMGKTLMVREFENYYPMDNMAANVMVRSKANYEAGGDVPAEDPTAFRKITLQAQVTAQFEIK